MFYSTCWICATRLNCAHGFALDKTVKVTDELNSISCALNISCGVLCRVKAETTCHSTAGTFSWSTWRYRSDFVSARTRSHRHVCCRAVVRCTEGSFRFLLVAQSTQLLGDQVDRHVKTHVPRLVVWNEVELFTI